MILKIRIDDRLLHGQVAYSWKSALSYDAIVIASDSAAKDEVRKMALKLCCPDGVRLATRTGWRNRVIPWKCRRFRPHRSMSISL